ncbi:hypothetical protein PWT90_04397 [Aphanocladium album]|nr:hypothetical protein PWT90_04397 [Aphanocladium album]
MFVKTATFALAAMAAASPVQLEAREHDDFRNEVLAAHNWYRSQHSAAPLNWDEGLANYALNWARQCSENPRHSGGPHGENIAWGTGWSSSYGWVNSWGNERTHFDFNNPQWDPNAGHFTQMVWKSTSRVGCGWAHCPYGDNVVCSYESFGNVNGEDNRYWRENVGQQTSGNLNDEFQG